MLSNSLKLCSTFAALTGALTFSEEIFVANTAQGAANGTSAANARSLAWLNDAINWGAGDGKISAGDTVHLTGTLTSSLNVMGGGAPGFPITILFEKDAKLSAPAWPIGDPVNYTGGAIVVNRKNFITIDGGENGIIECTDNGTLLGNRKNSVGINGTSASVFTVKNLTVRNMFVRVIGTSQTGSIGIQNTCKVGNPFTDFTVENCTISDASLGIDADYATGCARYTFNRNTIFNCNWGGRIGDRNSASTITDVVISNNNLSRWTNWDGTDAASQATFHHNGFYCWAESGGSFNKVTAFGNTVGPKYSSVKPNGATAGLFFSGAGMKGPISVYNNLFLEDPNDSPANGNIFIWPGFGAVSHIYNNTFIGGGGGIAIGYRGGRGGDTVNIKNNLCVAKNFISLTAISTTQTALSINNNIGYRLTSGEAYSISATATSVFKSLLQWQSMGFDLLGSAGDPKLSSDYKPLISGIASGTGADLSAYFTLDKQGHKRTVWDIGAFTCDEHPVAPVGLKVKF